MAFIKRSKAIPANIPTASMADIAFLLIIFFMVTTKFDVDRTRVKLPKSTVRNEVPKGSAYVVVAKDTAGLFSYKFSDGEKMSRPVADVTLLEAEVNAVAARDPGKPFVIKAEADTPYEDIDTALDILRQAGVENVVLLTEQRTVNDVD
ncbi:MAG TPA: biopolymer transporter ExbD [Acidobacteria bacterium]|nr:biopolymer transporter ExbD [Acidobacteriota bacterium]